MQASRHVMLFFCRFVGHPRFIAVFLASQRNIAIVWNSFAMLLSIFAYICFVAIDLCLALALSLAVVVVLFIRSAVDTSQFSRYLTTSA